MKAYVNYILNNLKYVAIGLFGFYLRFIILDKINAMEKYFEFKITHKELWNFKA
jgi:hypothetical protein